MVKETTTGMGYLKTNARSMVDMSGIIVERTRKIRATSEITAKITITDATGMRIVTIAGAAEVDPGHIQILLGKKRDIGTKQFKKSQWIQRVIYDTWFKINKGTTNKK